MRNFRMGFAVLLCLIGVAVLTAETSGVLRDLLNSGATRRAFVNALTIDQVSLQTFTNAVQYDTVVVTGATAGLRAFAVPFSNAAAVDDTIGVLTVRILPPDTVQVFRLAAAAESDAPYMLVVVRY